MTHAEPVTEPFHTDTSVDTNIHVHTHTFTRHIRHGTMSCVSTPRLHGTLLHSTSVHSNFGNLSNADTTFNIPHSASRLARPVQTGTRWRTAPAPIFAPLLLIGIS